MNRVCLLDGAMGTELMKRGVTTPRFPEQVNLTESAAVQAIHRYYIEAGSRIVYACTFGANPLKARGEAVAPVIGAALANARSAAGETAKVALEHGLPLLAQLPIDPALAKECDTGVIELFNEDWMEPVISAVENCPKRIQN